MLKASGYQRTLVVFGAVFAIIGLTGALMLRTPRAGEVHAQPLTPGAVALRVPLSARDAEDARVLADVRHDVDDVDGRPGGDYPIHTGGLARSFGIDSKTTVVILGTTLAAIPAALTFDRITNGLTRPFFGWVSDHIGRENTMGIAFLLEGIAIYLMLQYRTDPFMLVVLSGLVFFAWGEIFSLFPSTLTDTFGTTAPLQIMDCACMWRRASV